MQIQNVSNQNSFSANASFKFKLSKEAIKAAEQSTKLTYEEMTNLSMKEIIELMHERGSIKKPNKLKTWLADKYKKIGESLGLLEKHRNIYTDVD